jgi:hypothetical protein
MNMPSVIHPKPTRKTPATSGKVLSRTKKQPIKLQLSAEDIALDNAISAAASRSLAYRRS